MYDDVADLSLSIGGCEFTHSERDTSSEFTRVTTTVVLNGGEGTDDVAGKGEDVTYDAAAHDTYKNFDADLAGEYTLDSFSRYLDEVDLWSEPPESDAFRHYRRWAFESAALDLALRQANTDLGRALGREYDPVEFVTSMRLPERSDGTPSTDRIDRWLDIDPGIEFKLDAATNWDDELIETLAATDAVRVVDLKALYENTEVETPADPSLYRRVVEGLPASLIEDPGLTEETRPLFDGNEARLSWDFPITGIESIEALPFEPSWLNCKPSRFGTVESLLESIEHCENENISLYGGGQFELDVGRGQIQTLASLFYPSGPNDVAPRSYNEPRPREDVPSSPLDPPTSPAGYRWAEN